LGYSLDTTPDLGLSSLHEYRYWYRR
jgi:hypothetical protein